MSTNKQSKKSAKIPGFHAPVGPIILSWSSICIILLREAEFPDILRLGESRSEAPIYDICEKSSWDFLGRLRTLIDGTLVTQGEVAAASYP